MRKMPYTWTFVSSHNCMRKVWYLNLNGHRSKDVTLRTAKSGGEFWESLSFTKDCNTTGGRK